MFDGDELSEIEEQIARVQEVGWTDTKLLLHIIRKNDERWERLMAAVDDLMAALAADQVASDAAVTLLQTLNGQVATLTQTIVDLQAAGTPNLQPAIDQANAITAELTAAETPPAPPVGP